MTKKKFEPDDKDQSARFVETAKALESDEIGKEFELVLSSIVVPKRAASRSHPSSKKASR